MNNLPYYIVEPKGPKVPILLSVPHSGTEFPAELKNLFKEDKMNQPDDTDWFVHQLYEFASEMGITLIHAKYSRWVVDLNRDPESKPLYNDGRIITGLAPTTDFFGNAIYNDASYVPSTEEMNSRIQKYYEPYHNKIGELLQQLKATNKRVLLWDAHSIRKNVPTIHPSPFPDLILGDNDEQSADQDLIDCTMLQLNKSSFEVKHNTPFKGGYITRSFGKPSEGYNALQLEMAKIRYMKDDELVFCNERANEMRVILKAIFKNLIETLG